LRGGEGGPAMKPGSAVGSILWDMVAKDKMPPGPAKLSDTEKSLLRGWIDGGAKEAVAPTIAKPTAPAEPVVSEEDRNFWSFKRPARPAVPEVKAAARVRNPIDNFLLAALEAKGLTLSPEADRLTLLRRAYADLIGLPPRPREVGAFANDT